MVRVPVKRKKVSLVRGAAVTAEPLVAWRAGDLYLTAVKLTNRHRPGPDPGPAHPARRLAQRRLPAQPAAAQGRRVRHHGPVPDLRAAVRGLAVRMHCHGRRNQQSTPARPRRRRAADAGVRHPEVLLRRRWRWAGHGQCPRGPGAGRRHAGGHHQDPDRQRGGHDHRGGGPAAGQFRSSPREPGAAAQPHPDRGERGDPDQARAAGAREGRGEPGADRLGCAVLADGQGRRPGRLC